MAFYPTWQADPTQGWQNQFIQQIPQNTPTITPLNSLEFQPQSYAYQPNSYVQTGLGFDPNYGRPTYATPVQRYEFQTNQLPLSNQVSLQSVNFAPTVTYAGQVATGPALLLGGNTQNGSDPNKQLSGNEMPGYPRVSNVPPRSLNCNGYPGSEYGGSTTSSQQSSSSLTTSASTMQPPSHIPQSPSRTTRPNSSNQMYSPSHLSNSHMQSYNSSPSHSTTNNGNGYGMSSITDNQNGQSPSSQSSSNQEWSWNNGMTSSHSNEMFNQSDRVNLNTRLKTMILNKGESRDSSDDAKLNNDAQAQSQTGHFLSYSHHLRDTSNNMNDNNVCPPIQGVDTFGRGGVSDPWKYGHPDFQHQQHKSGSSKKSDFEQKQQSIEKSIEDSSRRDHSTDRYSSSYYSKQSTSNTSDKLSPHRTKSPSKHSLYPTKHDKVKKENPYDPYDFDSRNIKQEELPRPEGFKMEGYEKNYQSFIKYADFVDQQQNQSPQNDTPTSKPSSETSSQSSYYLPPYNYPGFQPYPTYSQGYTNLTPNSYTGQETPVPTSINQSSNSAFMPTNQSQTNFEQQIPAHTYPKTATIKTEINTTPILTPKVEQPEFSEFSQDSQQQSTTPIIQPQQIETIKTETIPSTEIIKTEPKSKKESNKEEKESTTSKNSKNKDEVSEEIPTPPAPTKSRSRSKVKQLFLKIQFNFLMPFFFIFTEK